MSTDRRLLGAVLRFRQFVMQGASGKDLFVPLCAKSAERLSRKALLQPTCARSRASNALCTSITLLNVMHNG